MVEDRTWMCAKCIDDEGMPLEFKNFTEYQAHNKKFHLKGVEAEIAKKEGKPAREPLIAPELPTATGEEVKRDIEARTKVKPGKIELTYKYVGLCPNCGQVLETIPLDIDTRKKDLIVVAWCSNCKEKRQQRSVIKL